MSRCSSIKNRESADSSPGVLLARVLAGALLIGIVGVASAAPVPPDPGFLPDAGDSYFGHGSAVMGIELTDPLNAGTEFGFYFQGNSGPGGLFSIFDAADQAPPFQVAQINFALGEVVDVDGGGSTQSTFTPSLSDIGFYLTVGGTSTIYSDPALNGGLDLFSAWQSISNPLTLRMVFEIPTAGGLVPININQLNPLTASVVPVPPSVWLMGSLLPLLMLVSRRRRRKPG